MFSLNRILFPTDFSDCADQALAHAAFLARQYNAALDLLHVIPIAPAFPQVGIPAEETETEDAVRQKLSSLVDAHNLGDLSPHLRVKRGEGIGEAILEAAGALETDLLVLGTHGRRGVRRWMMGSEAEEILRGAEVPVLAIRQQDPPPMPHALERVLVPMDLSAHSRTALAHAAELARRYDAHIDVLHVVQASPDYDLPGIYQAALPPHDEVAEAMETSARESLDALVADAGLDDASVHVVPGEPASTIVDWASDRAADLIVLSSHGRTGLDRFLMGSVAERTLRTTPCPVFVVKSYGRSLVQA